MLESKIEKWISEKIREAGGLSFKWLSPNNPGVPDRIYIFPGGKVFFVELKTEIGRLSNIQKWQRERLIDQGVNYRLIKGMKQAEDFVNEVCTTRLPEASNQ